MESLGFLMEFVAIQQPPTQLIPTTIVPEADKIPHFWMMAVFYGIAWAVLIYYLRLITRRVDAGLETLSEAAHDRQDVKK